MSMHVFNNFDFASTPSKSNASLGEEALDGCREWLDMIYDDNRSERQRYHMYLRVIELGDACTDPKDPGMLRKIMYTILQEFPFDTEIGYVAPELGVGE